MRHVACLIADPETAPLPRALAAEAGRALTGEVRWLAHDAACEVDFPGDAADAAALLATLVGDAPFDHAVLPAEGRLKRLLVSDMDSTIITVECIDELADYAGVKAEVAAVTRRAMNGELDFAAALRARVALLAGLPASVLDDALRERVRLMPGAATLVCTLKARGVTTALVSGGFTHFTRAVAALCGFDSHEANELEVRDGRLTGRVVEPVRGPGAKLAAFERLRAAHGLPADACAALGDGANDLPMIRAAGLGVGFRAHLRVAAEVDVNIRHGDLTAVLYLMGIAGADFVTCADDPRVS